MPEFLPFVRRWFSDAFAEATRPQREGWEAIAAGRDTLIVAPTGSGKTLAAFLWALDHLHRLGAEGRSTRPRLRRLRLAAARAEQRHREEPARAAGRHPRRRGGRRPRAPRGPRGGAHGRHAGRRPPGDDAPAAARPDHHARVALHPAHEPGLPARAGADPLRHRRRDPRDARRQARRPPGADARAPAGAGRGPGAGRAAAAHRLLGHRATGRGRAGVPHRVDRARARS